MAIFGLDAENDEKEFVDPTLNPLAHLNMSRFCQVIMKWH
jgi:hypothetical protein